jgi:hypothetical protein
MSDDADSAQAPSFRELLLEIQELYRECALEYAHKHPELINDSPEAFVDRMLELHRGLVLKVFVEVAQADQHVGPAELEMARDLFDHAWGRDLNTEQVKEAILHYGETTHLRWESLLRPFERFSSFIERAGVLQALVMQLARHVAHADGVPDPRTRRQLKWIRTEMQRILQRVPITTTAKEGARSAVRLQSDDFEIAPSATGTGQMVRVQPKADAEHLAEVLAELDGLIGLASIKEEVHELVNFLKIQAERRKFDLPQTPVSLHAVYTGNPGTGKTTVARLVGGILGAMGILARGHLVETDRSGLVAEYAGQTAPKTNKRIDEALDGVLFIDEAYSLVAESGDDPYGTEALQTLLKRMEDDRDRLVVILAGYPRPIETLLKRNPGLSSRFNRTFSFPDYTVAELGRIFETVCRRDDYRLPARTRAKLLLGFQYWWGRRDENFGNGRLARNVFERSVRRLANRLASVASLTRELLTTLQPEDLVLEGVPPSAWAGLDDDAHCFRLTCPGCHNASRLPQTHLGRSVQCRRCGHEFAADWGEVVPEDAGPV